MSTSPYGHFILFIGLSFGLLFSSCQNKKPSPKKASIEKAIKEKTPKKKDSVITTLVVPEVIPEPPNNPQINPNSLCTTQDFDLPTHLLKTAQKLELDSIPYSRSKGNDCSGMFHQLLNTVKKECPQSIYPSMANARDSRGIAKWYHQQNNLTIVRNAETFAHLIQPGVVMFYGYGQRKAPYQFDKLTIDSLCVFGKGINHVAVVVSVNRKDGVLESYEIFHGRNPKYPAGITSSRRVYQRHPELPIYGNWKEPWLAVANMLTERD